MQTTMRRSTLALAALCFALASHTAAKSRSSGHSHHSSSKSHTAHPRTSTRAQGVQRNSKGRIARDPKQKAKFEKTYPCPSTGKTSGGCPGYVVDHIRPLKRGG